MIRVISFGGKYAVFDSESLALIPVGPLAVPMVPYLKEPLPVDCPVSIRYALAQYPSPEISATYRTLREAWENGLLFAPARTEEPPVSRVILASPTSAAISAASGIAADAPYPVSVLLSDPDDPLSAVALVKEAIPSASVSVLLHGVAPSAPLLAVAEVLVVVRGASDPILSSLAGTAAVPVLDVPAGDLVNAVAALSAAGFTRISSLPASPEDARALAAKLRRMKDAAPSFLPFTLVRSGNVLRPVREAFIAPDGAVSRPVTPSPAQSPFCLLSSSSDPWSLACADQAVTLAGRG
ncbi:MAG: hypothetical protein MJ070_02625 [Lachnospiraceae bacterium]|nr:hypothetical protein [Lachnospiraceae bacterium]